MSACAPRAEAGSLAVHRQLEALVAEFVGKEDALTFGMGFATNSTNMPLLVDKVSLALSLLLQLKCYVEMFANVIV